MHTSRSLKLKLPPGSTRKKPSDAMPAPGCRYVALFAKLGSFAVWVAAVTPEVVVPSPLSLTIGIAARDVGLLRLTVKQDNSRTYQRLGLTLLAIAS
jgi:hypothetical protein